MHGSKSEQRGRVLAGLALGLGLGLSLPGAAEARSVTLRWRFAAPERAAGFRVHVGTQPGVYSRTIDVGKPAPDAEGVYRASIEVADGEPAFLAVSAYGERGEESERSNETVRAPGSAAPAAALQSAAVAPTPGSEATAAAPESEPTGAAPRSAVTAALPEAAETAPAPADTASGPEPAAAETAPAESLGTPGRPRLVGP